MSRLRNAILLSCTLCLGCDASRLNGTALLVTSEGGLASITQLRFQASDERGAIALPPMLRPEVAQSHLSSTNVVRVLLPDALAGQTLELLVEGMFDDQSVVAGRALVQVELGSEVPVTVVLTVPQSGCGAGPSCAAGQHCSAGTCMCDPTSCTGCCNATNGCEAGTAKSACGSGANTCRSCPTRCRSGACD